MLQARSSDTDRVESVWLPAVARPVRIPARGMGAAIAEPMSAGLRESLGRYSLVKRLPVANGWPATVATAPGGATREKARRRVSWSHALEASGSAVPDRRRPRRADATKTSDTEVGRYMVR